MDPGLDFRRAEFIPDRLLVPSPHADPERRPRLEGEGEGQPAGLGGAVAGRDGELVAEPGGEEEPGVGRDGPPLGPPLDRLRTARPVRGVAGREQPVRVAPRLPRPDAEDLVNFSRVEQPGQEELILDADQPKGLDPAPPPQERREETPDELAVAPLELAA